MRRLNLGCGGKRLDGYVNVDVVPKDIFTDRRVVEELEGAGFANVSASNARYGNEPVSVNINAVAHKPDGGLPNRPLAEPNGRQLAGRRTPTLSLVINTLNEERHLEDCLRSLDGCADEIVVVDMRSDDRTVEIARRYTDRILFHDRTGIVEPARQFAIDQARGEWVLLMDADERLTPDLARLVRHTIANGSAAVCYRIPRRNFIAGRWMTGTGWGTDVEWQPRLFRCGVVAWPCELHGAPIVRGPIENLAGSSEAVLLHYNYRDLREFVERLNTYTDFEAEKLLAAGEVFSWSRAAEGALAEVRNRYEPHKDGVHSLVLSMCMAFYRFMAWAKLWERCGYPDADLPASWQQLLGVASPGGPEEPSSGCRSDLDRGDRALSAAAWEAACEAYMLVLEQDRQCARARSGLGLALVGLGDTTEGLAQLEEGVRLAPTPDLVSNLACGFLHVGRLAEAERLLEGVVAVAPEHKAARFNLARLREAQGTTADA